MTKKEKIVGLLALLVFVLLVALAFKFWKTILKVLFALLILKILGTLLWTIFCGDDDP